MGLCSAYSAADSGAATVEAARPVAKAAAMALVVATARAAAVKAAAVDT